MLAITPMWWIMWGVFLAITPIPRPMGIGIGLIVLTAGLLAPAPPSSDTRGKRERGADGRWERRIAVCLLAGMFAAAWFALRRG